VVGREKRLKKQEKSLLERAEEHRIKAETEKGRKDTTQEYWLGEAERFEKQAAERLEILKRIRAKKKK